MTSQRRRPDPMGIMVGAVVLLVVVLLPLVLVGAGSWLIYQRAFGDQVQAEVLSCDISHSGRKVYSEHCTARWTHEGEEHVGPIQNSGEFQEGETITATVHGDQIYGRNLALPLILLGLGLPLCVFPVMMVRDRVQRIHRKTDTPGSHPA